jgi:hypothetical protein
MTRDVRWVVCCDPCELDGDEDVQAVAAHTISIDGGPVREFDLCPRDERLFQAIMRIYKEGARDVLPPPEPEPAPVKKARTKKAAKPKELPAAPVATADELPVFEEEQPSERSRLRVWCPLPHRSEGGKGKSIGYADRNSHADMSHDHAKIWDIAWEDPEGIFPKDEITGLPRHACRAHKECMEVNLAFTTAIGLVHHIRGCSLPRVDES